MSSENKMILPVGKEPTDDIWDAMFTQRAIRYWQDKPIPREALEKIVKAASKAPSGSNTQPWVFIVIDDDDKRQRIGDSLLEIYESNEGLKELLSAGEGAQDKTQRLMLKGAKAFFSGLGKAPAIVIPCLYQLSSPTPDPTSLLAGSSIYGAIQNLMLAARALGLGSVLTTAQAMLDEDLRSILEIPSEATPVALIPIGYPDANFGPTKRKDINEIIRWNGWS